MGLLALKLGKPEVIRSCYHKARGRDLFLFLYKSIKLDAREEKKKRNLRVTRVFFIVSPFRCPVFLMTSIKITSYIFLTAGPLVVIITQNQVHALLFCP